MCRRLFCWSFFCSARVTVLTPSPIGSCPRVRVPAGTFREHACWMSGSRGPEGSESFRPASSLVRSMSVYNTRCPRCPLSPLLRPAARLRHMCMCCAFGQFAWLPHACEQEAAKEKHNAIWGVTAKTRCYATQASGRLRRATSCGAKTTTCASTSSTAT